MKHLLTTLLLAFSFLAVNAQNNPNAPKFEFIGSETHDFGELPEGPIAEHVFKFKNTGKEPLIIQGASASCGCTVPEWPKQPILPGKNGEIRVKYNTQGRVSPFNKDIYIQSNAVVPDGRDRYELHIKGTVLSKDDYDKKHGKK